jgi:hypothetical protein
MLKFAFKDVSTITTFKIVFTFDGFFCAETTMHCKVTCILYKKQAHFSQLLNHEILKPAISGLYIRFHPVYRPRFYFTRKQMTPFYWQQNLPDNREYIKIQEHCKVTCILYKKQAHFSQLFCLQVRSVTPWQLQLTWQEEVVSERQMK